MNYLVHLYLSDPDPQVRLGNLLGDWVKGRLEPGLWPPKVLLGLRQHRAVDRFCLNCEPVRRSRRRLDPRFGLLRAVLVDIFYDHLLAAHWSRFHTGTLVEFAAETYSLLEQHTDLLPEAFLPVSERMRRHDWLSSYADPATLPLVLERLAARLRRPGILAQGVAELGPNRAGLLDDLAHFLPQAREMLHNAAPSLTSS